MPDYRVIYYIQNPNPDSAKPGPVKREKVVTAGSAVHAEEEIKRLEPTFVSVKDISMRPTRYKAERDVQQELHERMSKHHRKYHNPV